MPDSAADVIADALTHHRPATHAAVHLHGDVPDQCHCGASDLAYGDRWEAHLADITVAALTQAGLLGIQPVSRVDYTTDARWRAAALEVCAAWLQEPEIQPGIVDPARGILAVFWPTLATALTRLHRAKIDLIKERP